MLKALAGASARLLLVAIVNGQVDLPSDGQETSPLAAKEFPTGGQQNHPRMAK